MLVAQYTIISQKNVNKCWEDTAHKDTELANNIFSSDQQPFTFTLLILSF